jgi:putative transposase
MATRYVKNAGAVYSLKYHLVWCPKYRRPVLADEAVEARLRDLIMEVAVETEARVHALEVMPDHVHLFVESDPRWAIVNLVNRFKGRTSRILRQEFPALRSRLPSLWSRSYFASSVGSVSEVAIQRYIEAQKGI